MKIDLINSYNQYTKHEDKPKEENDPESRSLHRSQRKKRIKNRSELSSNFNDSKNYTYWDIFANSITGKCNSSSKVHDIQNADLTFGQRMMNDI